MGQKTCRMATGVHIGMPYAYHLRTSVENAYLPIRSLPVYGGSCSSLILKLITANASADQPLCQISCTFSFSLIAGHGGRFRYINLLIHAVQENLTFLGGPSKQNDCIPRPVLHNVGAAARMAALEASEIHEGRTGNVGLA